LLTRRKRRARWRVGVVVAVDDYDDIVAVVLSTGAAFVVVRKELSLATSDDYHLY
jgi:hypothetical protein